MTIGQLIDLMIGYYPVLFGVCTVFSMNPVDVFVHSFFDYGSRDSASILISMRYDFQPRCLLRKVMEATEAFSGIGWIDTSSG